MRFALILFALCSLAAPAWAGEECSLQIGDFDADHAALCTGSCRWTDIAPNDVVRVLQKPGQWHRTFRPLVAGRLLPDGRLVQIYKAKPFAQRQVTVEFEVNDSGDGYRVSWSKALKQEPVSEGLLEIRRFDGWWEVRPDGEGGSIVTHGARFDPGDDIPAVLVRKGMPIQIRRLLRQLRRAVTKG
jgi:hypothetical protein